MSRRSHPLPADDAGISEWVAYYGGDVSAFERAYAGRQIYIPARLSRAHPLAKTIGFEAASLLCDELGGDTFVVAMGKKSKGAARRLLVLLLSWAGISVGDIAAAGEMTARHALKLRADLRREELLPPARNCGNSLNNERF